jgi:hypothetical protein
MNLMINESEIQQRTKLPHKTTQQRYINTCQYSQMSTAVPADTQCYVTQCHQYTPDGYPQHQDCITSVYFQSYPLYVGNNKKSFITLCI